MVQILTDEELDELIKFTEQVPNISQERQSFDQAISQRALTPNDQSTLEAFVDSILPGALPTIFNQPRIQEGNEAAAIGGGAVGGIGRLLGGFAFGPFAGTMNALSQGAEFSTAEQLHRMNSGDQAEFNVPLAATQGVANAALTRLVPGAGPLGRRLLVGGAQGAVAGVTPTLIDQLAQEGKLDLQDPRVAHGLQFGIPLGLATGFIPGHFDDASRPGAIKGSEPGLRTQEPRLTNRVPESTSLELEALRLENQQLKENLRLQRGAIEENLRAAQGEERVSTPVGEESPRPRLDEVDTKLESIANELEPPTEQRRVQLGIEGKPGADPRLSPDFTPIERPAFRKEGITPTKARRESKRLQREEGFAEDEIRITQEGREATIEAKRTVPDNLTPEQKNQLVQLDEEFRAQQRIIKESKVINDQIRGKRLKALGHQTAAQRRLIIQGDSLKPVPGGLTAKELTKVRTRKEGFYTGKPVLVNGQKGVVKGTAFGKVKVKLEDGPLQSFDADTVLPVLNAERELRGLPDLSVQETPTPVDTPLTPQESITPRPVDESFRVEDVRQQPKLKPTQREFTDFDSDEFRFLEPDRQSLAKELDEIAKINRSAKTPQEGVAIEFDSISKTGESSTLIKEFTPLRLVRNEGGKSDTLVVEGVNQQGKLRSHIIQDFSPSQKDLDRASRFGVKGLGIQGKLTRHPGKARFDLEGKQDLKKTLKEDLIDIDDPTFKKATDLVRSGKPEEARQILNKLTEDQKTKLKSQLEAKNGKSTCG